jgi:hypothetical protein
VIGQVEEISVKKATAITAINQNTNTNKQRKQKSFDECINLILNNEQRSQIRNVLEKFQSVFSKSEFDIGRTGKIKHRINVNNKPIKQSPYSVPRHLKNVLYEKIDEMLEKDIIEPSDSPWSSPVVLVAKKDGSTRFCVDFRKLNKSTLKDAYPIPKPDEQLNALVDSKYFSSIDLTSGFWQIEMHSGDKEKTAFCIKNGLYQFKVMPMGLTNAPLTFQRCMDNILRTVNWKKCLCFFDDILVFGRTFDEHLARLAEVISIIQAANLKINLNKCKFGLTETTFLGHLITGDGIKPDPSKVQAIINIQQPTSVTQVKSFIGICSYYRRFIPKFSEIAQPLFNLTKQTTKFLWDSSCQTAFETLKSILCSYPL